MKNKRKLIAGVVGLGNFGTLLASILKEDYEIKLFHNQTSSEAINKARAIGAPILNINEITECNLVFLCVPISKTEAVIKDIAPRLKNGAILMDTCSVKVLPCRWLKKYSGNNIQIMGTHPMFGPTTSKFDLSKQSWDLKGLQIILCPIRINNSNFKIINSCFAKLGLKTIITSPEDHDQQNAKTLSFVHFIGRSFLATGIGEQKIYTPGYADLLKILPHTTSDNWQLFYDMNNYNPFAKKLRKKFFLKSLELEEKIILNKEAEELDNLREAIDYIDDTTAMLLEKRFLLVAKIKNLKIKKKIATLDSNRELQIVNTIKKNHSLRPAFISNLFKLIFNESYKIQK
jgi:prephenate dehydrogenase